MTTAHFYLSHPEVQVDPATPVARWSLSAVGRARVEAASRRPWVRDFARIVSSHETKALETATILADAAGVTVVEGEDMGENDRSATGFLPPDEFENTADAFFANPHASVRGWERACDAQTRIVRAVRTTLATRPYDPTLFVGHGGVGTLLVCAIRGVSIDRAHDQGRTPAANPRGGNLHIFDADLTTAFWGWTAMESL